MCGDPIRKAVVSIIRVISALSGKKKEDEPPTNAPDERGISRRKVIFHRQVKRLF